MSYPFINAAPEISQTLQLCRAKVRLLKEFSKVAMTNHCRRKFYGVTIFL